jgi:hypothetical protein
MDSSNDPLLPIRDQNRQTIRGFDDKQYALSVGKQSIPGQYFLGNFTDNMKDVRMDLSQKEGFDISHLRMRF